ncbi:transcription-repair coupling factor [Chloroflexota bacterium]
MTLALNTLLQLIEGMPSYHQLVSRLGMRDAGVKVAVLDAAEPYLIAALYHSLQRPVLVITAQPENSHRLYEQLLTWCGDGQVKIFLEPDALPYERITVDNAAEMERLQVLSALAKIDGDKVALPPLIVTYALALVQKTASFHDFTAVGYKIEVKTEVEPFHLLRRWQAMGYKLEKMVEVPGTISHRGGIIDIYPPTSDLPVRLEFFGNTVDSIRLFDPSEQRSLREVPSVAIGPASELLSPSSNINELASLAGNIDLSGCRPEFQGQFQEGLSGLISGERPDNVRDYASMLNRDSILAYLSPDALLILDKPQNIRLAVEDLEAKAEELRAEKLGQGELPSGLPRPYFTWDELEPVIEVRQSLALSAWGVTDHDPGFELDFAVAPNYVGQLPEFIRKAKQMLADKQRIIIVSHQASRLSELLEEEDVVAPPLTEVKRVPEPGSLTLVQGLLGGGWVMNGDTHLLTDAEIFGFIKQRRLLKKRPVSRPPVFVDMTSGDYVVHIEHGIARFSGIRTMKSGGAEKEYMALEYSAGDRLYVPADQIDRVSRYIGAGEHVPVLSRLGTQEWSRTRQKVKESVEDIAQELLALYATREVVPGFAFSSDTIWQREMEGSFPYIETPDQMTAQQQVKEDMEQTRPMDRLVCGDVGYGKTEVALRAAFKGVMDGKQVAVLVPTTVLAQQHFVTFSQRLAAFPLRVEVLSRFHTHREQQVILEGLGNGSVDICIGTHRMIQKDVVFKNLGLLIIDEEQRFGVGHKEFLKRKRQEVDVLALSATPIPRTLHMSLVGVRDMSVMETPPEDRLPIKTYVAEYSQRLIRDAIIRELERNGQVFFVHNRVQSIAFVANQLREIVPEAKITIAHGQMREAELQNVMDGFIQGKSDVLVCTSIIESGLDMPNVNTIMVNRADRFGLTQLYQLRGRIGRGINTAYAYFLYDQGKRLTPVAEKRLRTIFEATELGAGFGIAMKDLEIRGAGSLLGVRQSGHISAVGYHLYTRMLAQAVEEQKAKRAGVPEEKVMSSRLPPPTVDLPFPAYIPEEYVADLRTRLGLYQKLAVMDKVEQLEAMAGEFRDRFGALPAEVENLLYAVRVKLLATDTGLESVTTEHGEIILRLFEGMRFDKHKLEPLARDGVKIGAIQLTMNHRRLGKNWREVLEEVVGKLG